MAGQFAEDRFEDFNRWNPEMAEVLGDLLRSLRRKKGFGLFFVQCSPAQGQRVMDAVRKRFPRKRSVQVELNRQSKTLYPELLERYQTEKFEIAFVTGVEQTLYDYEDTKRLAGWSSEEIYNYSWKGVPPLLSHLNRQRETFAANLPIALIFLVPRFVIDYFVQRAPDFFDWRSGFFKFSESAEDLEKVVQQLVDKEYNEYETLTSEQRIERILEIKDRILQLDPSACDRKSSLFQEQGKLFASERDFNRALECYDRALAIDPKNDRAWYDRGDLFFRLEKYEEAIESYDLALEIKPTFYDAWGDRGMALYRLQRYEEALSSINRALEIEKNEAFLWNYKGLILSSLKQYMEAAESFEHAIELDREFHYAWYNRGIVLYNLGRYKEALSSIDSALEIKQDDGLIWFFRGRILEEVSSTEKVAENYERALEINYSSSKLWYALGSANQVLSNYQKAIESYEKALEIEPDYYWAWASRGNTLVEMDRHEEAVSSFDRALEIQPASIEIWILKAMCLEGSGHHEEALSSYKKVAELNPENFWWWYHQSYGLYYLSQCEEAIAGFNLVIQLMENESKNNKDYSWSVARGSFRVRFRSVPLYAPLYGRSISLLKLRRYKEAFTSLIQCFLVIDLYRDAWKTTVAMISGVLQRRLKKRELTYILGFWRRYLGFKGG